MSVLWNGLLWPRFLHNMAGALLGYAVVRIADQYTSLLILEDVQWLFVASMWCFCVAMLYYIRFPTTRRYSVRKYPSRIRTVDNDGVSTWDYLYYPDYNYPGETLVPVKPQHYTKAWLAGLISPVELLAKVMKFCAVLLFYAIKDLIGLLKKLKQKASIQNWIWV
jgi:hypothetical protein